MFRSLLVLAAPIMGNPHIHGNNLGADLAQLAVILGEVQHMNPKLAAQLNKALVDGKKGKKSGKKMSFLQLGRDRPTTPQENPFIKKLNDQLNPILDHVDADQKKRYQEVMDIVDRVAHADKKEGKISMLQVASSLGSMSQGSYNAFKANVIDSSAIFTAETKRELGTELDLIQKSMQENSGTVDPLVKAERMRRIGPILMKLAHLNKKMFGRLAAVANGAAEGKSGAQSMGMEGQARMQENASTQKKAGSSTKANGSFTSTGVKVLTAAEIADNPFLGTD